MILGKNLVAPYKLIISASFFCPDTDAHNSLPDGDPLLLQILCNSGLQRS